jgi:hypothetical protein
VYVDGVSENRWVWVAWMDGAGVKESDCGLWNRYLGMGDNDNRQNISCRLPRPGHHFLTDFPKIPFRPRDITLLPT